MKKHTVSRRKFLTGLGIAAAGSAALTPAEKLGNTFKSNRSLVSAWSKPQSAVRKDLFFTDTKFRYRAAESHLLPLDRRPV